MRPVQRRPSLAPPGPGTCAAVAIEYAVETPWLISGSRSCDRLTQIQNHAADRSPRRQLGGIGVFVHGRLARADQLSGRGFVLRVFVQVLLVEIGKQLSFLRAGSAAEGGLACPVDAVNRIGAALLHDPC